MSKADILIVDDEANTLASLARAFRLAGHEATVCDNAAKALELAKARPFDLILSDVVMPGRDGLALLEDLKTNGVAAPVVMMSGQAHIEMAVKATRLGALDFLEKPLSTDKLLLTVDNALRLKRLETENRELRRRVGRHELVWTGEAMRRVMAQIDRVAVSESRVCIYGETGTGKELVARTLHELSPRKSRPFVAVNCAAIPETLIESEIFGHEKGAFTGAAERRAGCFELAQGGTLLLDEIGEMPSGTQAKLLRVLEERKLRRLGARTEQEVDVRVLAATNRDPSQAVAQGSLRPDLYYRLNVFNIHMPPLREHLEDLPAMAEAMLDEMNRKHGRRVSGIGPSMMDRLMAFDWPGNGRELRNTIERAVILCADGAPLDAGHLPAGFGKAQTRAAQAFDASAVEVRVGTTVDEAERVLILRTLEATGQNRTRAAEILGVSLKTLHNKLKEYSRAREEPEA